MLPEQETQIRMIAREEATRLAVSRPPLPTYYRVEDVASILQVSARQVETWIAEGKLSFRKASGGIRRIAPEAFRRDAEALFSGSP